MKTIASKILSLMMISALMLSISATVSAQDATLKKMEGKWKFTMPDMGGGGSVDGLCTIATVDGETKATLASPMGEIVSSPLKLENDKYIGELNIESDMGSFQLKLAFKFNGDKLVQEIISDYGEMPGMEMTRAE
ncbi:MAG: hypothetical protein LBD21_06405 [Tannerellaceae bacterium]|jgi:hypothetical protein|nr:hypothetical protein [Tannerellaceae bacterium]